jgi:hypothetical protein
MMSSLCSQNVCFYRGDDFLPRVKIEIVESVSVLQRVHSLPSLEEQGFVFARCREGSKVYPSS